MLLAFVSRTVFIYELGIEYVGVNALFVNILGVLSFAELGIGSALNYSLYKPVAEGDRATVRSLMRFYRRVSPMIGLAVALLGAALLPFLDYFVKDSGDVGDLSVYYVIFLFNSVASYFAIYKIGLVYAEQKNYLITNFNMAATAITTMVQIAVLLVWGSFLAYLLAMAAMQVVQQILLHRFINARHPGLFKGDAEPISDSKRRELKTNLRALIWHKVGDISVHQTDSIIISTFISVTTVGLVSNYNLLLTSVSTLLNVAMTSVVSSLGNLFVTESDRRQYEVFRIYSFVAFWAYGFSAIALMTLSTPFIKLWLGSDFAVDQVVVAAIVVNFYFMGHRIAINSVKAAAGFWAPDRYVAVAQAVVNLVVSIALVREIGLLGVYIGTIVQGLLATVIKPLLVYRRVFHIRARAYFLDGAKYALAVLLAGLVVWWSGVWIGGLGDRVSFASFALLVFLVTLVPNGLFVALFRKTPEFDYVWHQILRRRR